MVGGSRRRSQKWNPAGFPVWLDAPHVRQNLSAEGSTAKNFKGQAGGADLLRLGVCFAVEDGLTICAPVHDAVLAECAESEIDETEVRLRAAMNRATKLVLGKDAVIPIVTKPFLDRFEDGDGLPMFQRVMRQLERVETATRNAA